MKKVLFVIGILLIAGSTIFLNAQDQNAQQGGMQGSGTMMGGGMDMMASSGTCTMCGMMMMGSKMVATADGGVVVMMGNKIMKYDKDLKKVKDTTVDIQEVQQSMMQQCPMMKGGVGRQLRKPGSMQ